MNSMQRMVCFVLMSIALLLAGPLRAFGATDDSQARAMLAFLRAVAAKRDARPLVDPLMAMKGTALVIAQQNLMRRVTAEQYREVLLAVAEHREPRLTVPEGDLRAMKGKQGLLQDILPSLRWGCEHVDVLSSQLAVASALDVGAQANKLALENLPEPVPLGVPLYFVMGGRAGAAASDQGIYFDVLTNAFRNPGAKLETQKVVEFFAHEMHHVGLGQILDRRQSRLHLDENGQRAFTLLSGLVMEGSASYLINAHHDLTVIRNDPGFAAPGDPSSQLAAVEHVLAGVLQQNWTGKQYEEAMGQFTGSELHVTGALMFDAIWRAAGREEVMQVLRDPRQLLARYNRSAGVDPQAFQFSAALAKQVAVIGN